MYEKSKSVCIFFVGIVIMCTLGACATSGSVRDIENQESDNITGNESETLISEVNETVLQFAKDTDSEPSENAINEYDKNVPLGIEERYKSILLNGEEFVNIDNVNNHRKLSLQNIREVITGDDSIKAEATQFSIVDLDGNGENEIVLWLQINELSDYGYEILYCQDMEIYGFTLTYRQFLEPKRDGTFLTSGGAANTKVCQLQLSENGYLIEEVFNSGNQEEKANIQWYDLTEANVNENL